MSTALAIEQQATDVAERVTCIRDNLDALARSGPYDQSVRNAVLALTTEVERLAMIVATQAKG